MAKGNDGVVERARALVPVIQQNRTFSEKHARVAPDVVTACRDAGLFALAAPVEVGGVEAALPDQFEVGAIVSAADPGLAWVVMNSAACSRAAAWIDSQYWPEVYQSLGTFGWCAPPSGRLEPVDDGYVLSGSWPLMTGVLDAQWASVMCLLYERDERPTARQAVIPTDALDINLTWDDAVAMRSSGSHEISLPDSIFVPEGRVFDTLSAPRLDRPLYRYPSVAASLAIGSGLAVGMLEAAIHSAADELAGKVSSTFGQQAAKDGALQELMAEASMAASNLRFGTRGALETMWTYLERDERPPLELRAAVTGAPFHGVEVARDVISRLYTRSSKAAFFNGHPLERALRDIHAMAYGWETLRPLHHDVGRVAMGLDPFNPAF